MYADIDETADDTLECYRVYGLWYRLMNIFHIQCILPFRKLNMRIFLWCAISNRWWLHNTSPNPLQHDTFIKSNDAQHALNESASLTPVFDTFRPRQSGRHFPEDIFEWFFLYQIAWNSLKISLKFVPKVRINNIPLTGHYLNQWWLVYIYWRVCLTRLQWVKVRILKQRVLLEVLVFLRAISCCNSDR